MKKIGIITLSASDNCGSLLQAYALQEVLKERYNAKVEIINFNSLESKRVYSLFTKEFYKHPKKTLFTLKNLKSIKQQRKGYAKFREEYLNLTHEEYENIHELKKISNEYDITITGSDQVWNVYMTDYNDAFYLPWCNSPKKISYAASLGSTLVIDDKKKRELEKMLESFSAISVREPSGKKTIQNIISREVKVTSDPTLLFPREKWDDLAGKKIIEEDYIFYYSWSYPDENMNELVQKFAKKEGLPVYVINSSRWYKNRPEKFDFNLYVESGPLIFLNLMKHAKYVFVQSFHGAIFANVFRKRFFFLNEDDTKEIDFRTKNIIGALKQESQIVHDMEDINNALNTELSFESQELEKAKNISFDFLDENIN